MSGADNRVKVGIIGGAGYTAGELLRLLINHPKVEIAWVNSRSNAGKRISEVHESLEGETDLRFSDGYSLDNIDVLFLCSAHGASREFWNENPLPRHLKVVDLAQDYRDESHGYIYGLTDLNGNRVADGRLVANPGCFATAIQLSLLPLAAAGLLPAEINITALTGSTGAGVKPGATTHFSWRSDNVSVYKPFVHQHLAEIGRTLTRLQPSAADTKITFIPVRGDFARGIFAMTTLDCNLDEAEVRKLYEEFYRNSSFTRVSDRPVNLKQVVNTNKALIGLNVHDGKLLVTTAIDNLLKGASGQALENMNILCGFDPSEGLKLKGSAF